MSERAAARSPRRAGRRLGALVLAGLAGAVLAACGGAAPPAAPSLPDAAVTVGDRTVAAVAMGVLSDPSNTFWQLFSRVGTKRWVLVTPPGVATNGGIVAAVAGRLGIVAAVGEFSGLRFSPVAASSDAGRTWTAGGVPGAVLATPDAVGTSSGEAIYALLSGGGGRLVESRRSLTSWSTLATRSTIASSSCRLTSLTAVAVGPNGTVLVGGSCTSSSAPILKYVGGRWVRAGPVLGASDARHVVRIVGTPSGAVAIVEAHSTSGSELDAAVSIDDLASWSTARVAIGSGSVASTSVDASGAVTALVRDKGSLLAFASAGPGSPWLRLPSPPADTALVTAGPPATLQALAVERSYLTAYGLVRGKWQLEERLFVPILYGSSG